MDPATRVELHCHSTCSDGALPPEEVARRIAAAGVALAALTDHDSVDGLARFARVLRRHGVACVSGVEITAAHEGEEVHLLAYAFDPAHAGLQALLRAVRQQRGGTVHSIADSVRRAGAAPSGEPAAGPAPRLAGGELLAAADAIATVHRAGGRVFLAHPSFLRPDPAALRPLLAALRGAGLDGVEAVYGPDDPERRAALCGLARELGLAVCAGTDFHAGEGAPGVVLPAEWWPGLRELLGAGGGREGTSAGPAPRHKRRHFANHIVLPSLLALGLFAVEIWGFVLPAFERSLMDRKREMIRELTRAAWSILADAERQVQAGRVTRAEAQVEARDRIEALRYGRENKDYFWLQDMHPRMVMHPYRRELNGQDLSGYLDPRGARIFVEFADVVRRHGEGYVDYVWQWPDDPRRLEPKESYVKGFEPWGWVIGTGLYVEDVKHEIARLERGIVRGATAITIGLAWLLIHIVRYSRSIERERAEAVEELRETTERYRSLVEAATEGTLLVLDGRCRYANPHLLRLLGLGPGDLELRALTDVLPPGPANADAWERIDRALRGEAAGPTVAGVLSARSSGAIPCTLAVSRMELGGRTGLVLLARESASAESAAPPAAELLLAEAAAHAPAGVFRARLDRQGTLLAANPIARRLLGPGPGEGPLTLASRFADAPAFDSFLARLQRDGVAECRLAGLPPTPGARPAVLALRVALARDPAGRPLALDGLVEDVTSLAEREQERDRLLESLQVSLMALHEPVGRQAGTGVRCPGSTPVHEAAARMAARGARCLLVQDESGAVAGLVTARDLSERVLAAGADPSTPLRAVMSVPLVTVSESMPVHEALLRMRERDVRRLALTDAAGRVTGVVRERDLVPFERYGAAVLTREISRAALVEDVVRGCRRTPSHVKALLDGGARPRHVTSLLSSVCDAATERFVRLAVEELGPPPARFAFLALGSQGRQEQTLFTDQDNAIVYAAGAGSDAEAAAYFAELGRRVCGWLAQAGYSLCRGRVMAMNPDWCRSAEAWQAAVHRWVRRAEPRELLDLAVFFDFRAVCGDVTLAQELRRHTAQALREAPDFLPHFARHALLFKPPLIVLGRVILGGAPGGRGRALDLKDATMPIGAFARLYALRHELDVTHTLERLDALVERQALPPASRDEIAAAYDFLMRLRLRGQAQAVHQGEPPDNRVLLRRLGYSEKALLRQAFVQIAAVQHRIRYEFLGGT